MSLRFPLQGVDETYFDTAPQRFTYRIDVAADAGTVWNGLTVARPLSWCRMLTDVRYLGDPPFGEGVARLVEVGKVLRMREHFFRWDDEQRRHSFYVVQANMPLFASFAEDYQVTPTPTGSRLVWTFALTPRHGLGTALKLGAPLNKALFESFVRDTRRRFGTVVPTAGS
ncbi:SRPBCC family protein [Actinocrispum wychmicini]|uniref:SRPBCC family protein n=1 Tax=Actinocrispum wychmicini TaxID=1213861 RepID=UPI001A9D1D7F|nr:SRPBCC family protein [Actinocrispum wychmicini]